MSETEAVPQIEFADARLARELANVLNDTGLTEIEIERGDLRVRVVRALAAAPVALALPPTAMIPAPPAPPAATVPAAPPPPTPPAGEAVKSPMVGTVYLQPQPGAAAFIRVGDRVAEGQTLLLIEAMKTMNPIAAPRAGVIVEVLVADGQPVEYGEPLAIIGPA